MPRSCAFRPTRVSTTSRKSRDVSEFLIKEIEHFFTRYKDLEPGKWVKAEGWADRAAAEAELEASIKRYVPKSPTSTQPDGGGYGSM